jgi:NADH:ubiquinone oxidoreductase subunit 5 (subunit L)/multisubunit Na+/H+ antiporter MnhA subunit
MARISALFETDLKKIVALSTLRQLGVIFLALGLGGFMLRYFHLLTHAFFKALLFICTGVIIHRSKDYQDLRITGSSIYTLPTINRFILISRFRLIGLPFISAFFSKEIILEYILLKNYNPLIYFIIILGVGLTALYSARFILLVFSF